MSLQNAHNLYQQTQTKLKVHPVKLVHMLFSRVLIHLARAEEAVLENKPRVRGENLGKSIAIIAELNASINPEDKSEAAEFLRGLYEAILRELPKVSVTKDVRTIRQAYAYFAKLKEIWEQEAMPVLEKLKDQKPPGEEDEKQLVSPLQPQGYDDSEKLSGQGISLSA